MARKKATTTKGAVIATAVTVTSMEGFVTKVTDDGITVKTRVAGFSKPAERFYQTSEIVSAPTDEQYGRIIVRRHEEIMSLYGDIDVDNMTITLENDSVMSIPASQDGVTVSFHFDSDDGKTTSGDARVAMRETARLVRALERGETRENSKAEKAEGRKQKSSKKTSKKASKPEKVKKKKKPSRPKQEAAPVKKKKKKPGRQVL